MGQTDSDLSLVSFKLVTLLATGPWKKGSIILSVSEMDYVNNETGQDKDLWPHPQSE